VSLSALVAWNAHELGLDDDGLAEALDGRWDGARSTWVDAGAGAATSGRVRTLEGLLPALVCQPRDALAQLDDPAAFGGPFGPPGGAGLRSPPLLAWTGVAAARVPALASGRADRGCDTAGCDDVGAGRVLGSRRRRRPRRGPAVLGGSRAGDDYRLRVMSPQF